MTRTAEALKYYCVGVESAFYLVISFSSGQVRTTSSFTNSPVLVMGSD